MQCHTQDKGERIERNSQADICSLILNYYPAYKIIEFFLFSLSGQHMFFFLIQTEQGDIFKVTLETDDDIVSECFPMHFVFKVT